ncbi:putative disease resistance protein [Cinnamomum micranthum f. kanehirae]|uniref:Putative disease resistance protein n=1 Tax=Cinnamomum micranthum f. kanehirae TaxID=337451 RepID=A0A443N0K7_9MAGN|nr:putative disease resistance protein [Cinnamomum micranthum f. kanehirae]
MAIVVDELCRLDRLTKEKSSSAAEIVAPPVLEIVKLAWGHISRRIGHIKNLKKNMEELNNNAKYLFATRNDVKDKITSSLTKECDQWLEDVKMARDEVNNITKECREDKKCLAEWCPNIYS